MHILYSDFWILTKIRICKIRCLLDEKQLKCLNLPKVVVDGSGCLSLDFPWIVFNRHFRKKCGQLFHLLRFLRLLAREAQESLMVQLRFCVFIYLIRRFCDKLSMFDLWLRISPNLSQNFLKFFCRIFDKSLPHILAEKNLEKYRLHRFFVESKKEKKLKNWHFDNFKFEKIAVFPLKFNLSHQVSGDLTQYSFPRLFHIAFRVHSEY